MHVSQFMRSNRASSSARTRFHVFSVPARFSAIDRQVAWTKLSARLIEAHLTDLSERKNELNLSKWSRDMTDLIKISTKSDPARVIAMDRRIAWTNLSVRFIGAHNTDLNERKNELNLSKWSRGRDRHNLIKV